MKKIFLIIMIFAGHAFAANTNNLISTTLLQEWKQLRKLVSSLEPQGQVGEYMYYRNYDNMTLLWRISTDSTENEMIRFFMKRPDGEIFAVTYHKSDLIKPGTIVLRRFVGTEPTGWINHTINLNSGAYLGVQGTQPSLTPEENKIMKEWNIHPF